MSTKCSIFYLEWLHIYRDQMDDRVWIELRLFGRRLMPIAVR